MPSAHPPAAEKTAVKHPWAAVLSMSLCSFALVASEFLPVSLLTPLARDLALTEGKAGQAIAISGLFAVVASLLTSTLIAQFDRKKVLVSLTALMALSGVVVAFAPTYLVLMIGRALLGIAIGGCWSMSTAVMIQIVPESFVPKAIAVLQGGSALATAVAAPLGSFLGGMIGWRGAFFCVVPLALAALAWQVWALPSIPARSDKGTQSPLRVLALLAKPGVAFGMLALALLFMGQFTLFTYLRPYLETVAHVDAAQLSVILLVIGLAGLMGTMAIGWVLQRSVYAALVTIPVLMAVIALALTTHISGLVMVGALLAAWGVIATGAPVGWFTWLAQTLPGDAEAGGGLMVAVIQVAITAGATVGGLLYDGGGYRVTFLASAVLLLLAGALAFLASRVSPPLKAVEGARAMH
jgi:predicted MFS family arabinose efflux permease